VNVRLLETIERLVERKFGTSRVKLAFREVQATRRVGRPRLV
jgi:hypothetical protein